MKEKEFNETLEELNFTQGIVIEVYYRVDENGECVLDEESIMKECEAKIDEIKEWTK